MERPLNPFEILFLEATRNPSRESEFFGWVSKQVFFVPCVLTGAQALKPGTAGSRRVVVDAQTRLRLKAFPDQKQGEVETIVPFFSDFSRFEAWSRPDPEGQYAELAGSVFFALIPPATAAALLNPGSESFSKWFSPDEVKLVLKGK